jgi:hypothetical protein
MQISNYFKESDSATWIRSEVLEPKHWHSKISNNQSQQMRALWELTTNENWFSKSTTEQSCSYNKIIILMIWNNFKHLINKTIHNCSSMLHFTKNKAKQFKYTKTTRGIDLFLKHSFNVYIIYSLLHYNLLTKKCGQFKSWYSREMAMTVPMGRPGQRLT